MSGCGLERFRTRHLFQGFLDVLLCFSALGHPRIITRLFAFKEKEFSWLRRRTVRLSKSRKALFLIVGQREEMQIRTRYQQMRLALSLGDTNAARLFFAPELRERAHR